VAGLLKRLESDAIGEYHRPKTNPPRPQETTMGSIDHETKICRFCPEKLKDRRVFTHHCVQAFEDRHPVSPGHHLIVPKRHVQDWFAMSAEERRNADALILMLKDRLIEQDPSITGFNIGMNCGHSAGQTIFHAHIHLIPRRDGDTPNPTGGVRGVIPDKMSYCLEDG
jgi:ATP adenylyltransferase